MIVDLWLILGGLLYSLQLSAGSFPKPLTSQEEAHYLELASKGDLEARNILIERNLRLVSHIMKKYYAQTSDQEDLISIGTIGLIKAIDSFDADKGARLATYAARCIENEILMHYRGRKKDNNLISVSEPIDTDSEGNPLTLIDIISVDDTICDDIDLKNKSQQLYNYIEAMDSERDKQIIILRYGLYNQKEMTQNEIAKTLGISRSYVSRIEKRVIEELREKFFV